MIDAPNLTRRVRAKCGMTQHQFAELVGASRVTVVRWESDAAVPPGPIQALLRLIEANTEEAMMLLAPSRAPKKKPKATKEKPKSMNGPQSPSPPAQPDAETDIQFEGAGPPVQKPRLPSEQDTDAWRFGF